MKNIKKRIGELRERVKELEEDLYSANKIVEEYIDSIPKQKIKDKIEELKDENYQISLGSNILLDTQITKNNFKIQVLEELLEGGRK